MSDASIHNFHLPLPEDLYQALRKEAKQAKQPLTQFTREILKNWFKHKHYLTIEEEIAHYATNFAGTECDLDENLESASIEHLLNQKENKDKK